MRRNMIKCWRCESLEVGAKTEKLDDGMKLEYWTCDACRSTWYTVEAIAPYVARLRAELRKLRGVPETTQIVLPQQGLRETRPP